MALQSPIEWYDDDRFLDKANQIMLSETSIDLTKDIYLITWNPDPKLLPNDDFENQHRWCVTQLSFYCKTCDVATFCLESTQKGNPHYHGFYQRSDDPLKEKGRIMMIKKLQFYAPNNNVKIDKIKKCYRINSYLKGQNALYYYKKDIFTYYIYGHSVIDSTTPTILERLPGPEEYELTNAQQDSNGLLSEYIAKYFK